MKIFAVGIGNEWAPIILIEFESDCGTEIKSGRLHFSPFCLPSYMEKSYLPAALYLFSSLANNLLGYVLLLSCI